MKRVKRLATLLGFTLEDGRVEQATAILTYRDAESALSDLLLQRLLQH
jgi:hypothetical protein